MPPQIFDRATNEARKYWRGRLDELTFDGYIALDHPRPKDDKRVVLTLDEQLEPELHAALKRLSSGNPFLAFTALLLALRCACHRYSGASSVAILSPSMAGSSGHLLPIVGAFDGAAAFKQALVATKDLLSGAYTHHQYSFSRIVLDLPEERRPEHPFMSAALAGLHAEVADDPCDIRVRFEVGDDATRVEIAFDARVHDQSTIERFYRLFCTVASLGLADLSAPVGGLGVEPTGPGAGELHAAPSLRESFEAHVQQRPDAPALVHGERVTTYAELDRLATELADTLDGLSLDLRRPVGLVMDAGMEQTVAMLAVAKLGGAFAQLGPSGVAALGPECVICQREKLDQLGEGLSGVGHVLSIAEGAALEIMHHRDLAPGGAALAGAVRVESGTACVLVEEGSQPAVRVVAEAELVGVFAWLAERCQIEAGDRSSTASPDPLAQLHATLGMLAAGASVELARVDHTDVGALLDHLANPTITIWELSAAAMQNALPQLLADDSRPGPRAILLTGVEQSPGLMDALAGRFPDTLTTGVWADAKVGVWSTAFESGALASGIPGFEHRVLNGAGLPVPAHAIGELHLRRPSGELVATGLRVQPLDAGRMRWLRGPEHSFVKRECRVELTRIEALLCEHELIHAAEVTTIAPERGGDDVLAAFVLTDPERMSAESIRDYLLLRDDIDLVPDGFVPLAEFPLTATAAIDREALTHHVAGLRGFGRDQQSVEAAEVQTRLEAIWSEILQVEDIRDEDSFFALGGNSLMATLLLARITDEFGVDLSVQKFFREPSIRAVSQLIAAEMRTSTSSDAASEFKIVPRERYRVQLPDEG